MAKIFCHVFGDCHGEKYDLLNKYFSKQQSGILATALIDQAAISLQSEVISSKYPQQAPISPFNTIKQLNEQHHASNVKHLGIDNALNCILQLCHYVDYVEKSEQAFCDPHQSIFLGGGVGLLCAALIASSPTTATLISNALQAILLSFRLGSYVGSVAERISNPNQRSNPVQEWAYNFPGLDLESAELYLNEFNESNPISKVRRAYISGISRGHVQISAPPSILQKIIDQGVFTCDPIRCSVYGPYRAPHLHSSIEVDDILSAADNNLQERANKCRLKSPTVSSGETWLSGCETTLVVHAATHQYLSQRFLASKLARNCASALTASKSQHCAVIAHGCHELAEELIVTLTGLTSIGFTHERSCQTTESIPGENSPCELNWNSKLAIVGMGGRFPDADNTDELWDLLCDGNDVHRIIPEDRFPVESHVDPEGKATNTSYTPYGCWVKSPGLFDHKFFNMSPREALQTDPMQRLAIVTAYEALEMSGYTPNRTPSTRLNRIGTFYGQTSDDWREINAAQEIDTYYITGGIRAFGPGRINYFFKFKGPSYNIDTACSSSAAALQVACTSLLAKECDTAVVGGLSILTNPDLFCGLSRGQFLSKKGSCATFDDAADGYCRADACASLVVKRLEDAISDKDKVLAVILGTATNHSADSISITHPHGPTQSSLYSAILDKAGVDPIDVDYIEMHGTGTQAGDSTEMASVLNVFAPENRRRDLDRPLYLGTVKPNVGHGEAASGVTSVIKLLKMLQHDTIPPHVGIKTGSVLNRAFPKDLAARNVNIVFKNTPFKRRDGKPRLAFVNNFSAAGGNTALLLEDAPPQLPPVPDPRDAHIISVTGKSKSALMRNAEKLAGWMAMHPEIPVSHVAYTTTARRIQYDWRISVAASTLQEAQAAIETSIRDDKDCHVGSSKPPLCFVFTGQGSSYKGMGQEYYKSYSCFRKWICDFERVAHMHGFPSFMSLISGDDSESCDTSPIAVQLAILCFEMAALELWLSWGVKPAAVLGHSLGEYAALYASGVLSASDTIYLVGERAKLVVQHCSRDSHAMMAVNAPAAGVLPILDQYNVHIACLNSPKETVLSGSSIDISRAVEQLKSDGLCCTLLRVPFAFHTSQMDPILDKLDRLAHNVSFSNPEVPFISSLLGRPVDEIGPTYIRDHARGVVRFSDAVCSAQKLASPDSAMLWLEVGPHSSCTNMIRTIIGTSAIAIPTARRGESMHKVLCHSISWLHGCGIDLDWNEFHRDFSKSTTLVDLPSYSFEKKNHWIPYEGDWTLSRRKGSTSAALLQNRKLSTTSVHQIVRQVVLAGVAMIDTETNLSRDDIRPTITGHRCNGVALCPASLYAEIAMAVSEYAYKLICPGHGPPGLNVADLSIQKALLFDDKADAHILHCTVQTSGTGDHASVVFYTRNGLLKNEHARCTVHYGDLRVWAAELARVNYLVEARIDALASGNASHAISKFNQPAAYQSFASFVDYGPQYQGMKEVLLCAKSGEATAELSFQASNEGNFFFNPYWIDGCCHLSGFILNAKEAADSSEEVFISEGWESLRFIERLREGTTYRSYTRMQPVHGMSLVAGDVHILRDKCIIGVANGVKFRSVPKRALHLLLPPTITCRTSNSQRQSIAELALQTDNVNPKITNKGQGYATFPALYRTTAQTSLMDEFLRIVQVEVGCETEDLGNNATFTSLGCDSLMVLVIASRVHEELEINIRPQAFLEYPTIGEFKEFLASLRITDTRSSDASTSSTVSGVTDEPDIGQLSDSESSTSRLGDKTCEEQEETKKSLDTAMADAPIRTIERVECLRDQFPNRKAKSVLLQGSRQIAFKNLFMIPDGSGSAYSYSELGSLGSEWAIWGLVSPFMKTPHEYTCGVEGIARKFLEEMKQRQPVGPYVLAGWSIGGTIAYEITRQLTRSDEQVSHLILIDAPCPLLDDPLPRHLGRWFADIGIIGSKIGASLCIPDWILPHFDMSAKAFADYKPVPISRDHCPNTMAVWCEDGVCRTQQDPRPNPYPTGHALFLLENRGDFGPNRWDELLALEKIQTRRMRGNHFTIMREPLVRDLTAIVHEALISDKL